MVMGDVDRRRRPHPRPLELLHRRGAGQPALRLPRPARRRARPHRPRGHAACSCTWCRRAAASASATRSAPTRSRTRASTPSTPTCSSASTPIGRSYDLAAGMLRDLGVTIGPPDDQQPGARSPGSRPPACAVVAHESHWVDHRARRLPRASQDGRMSERVLERRSTGDPGSCGRPSTWGRAPKATGPEQKALGATVIDPALEHDIVSWRIYKSCEIQGDDVLVHARHPDRRVPAGGARASSPPASRRR